MSGTEQSAESSTFELASLDEFIDDESAGRHADEYREYAEEVSEDIRDTMNEKLGQPILFFGSGASIRYFDGPNWEGLLEEMADRCPAINREFAYYIQGSDEKEVGQRFSELYRDWAWDEGRDHFPDELFDSNKPSDVYLKHEIAEYFKEITPDSPDEAKAEYQDEIESLQRVVPQAIITTNYDTFLESLFDYQPVVGQEILTSEFQYPSQIYKIHGCVSEPEKLVLTEDDYAEFDRDKKYLSAKLLTYFAEHPVLIAGYSAQDPNVRRILSDIDRILSSNDGFVDHIYLLNRGDPSEVRSFERRKRIRLGDDRSITVKQIRADSWSWVFESFASETAIGQTHLKLLRRLMNNVYDMVVSEAPRREVQVNYQVLKNRVEDGEDMATIFGITPPGEEPDNPTNPVFNHPYRPSDLADAVGLGSYQILNDKLDEIAEETGIEIRNTNNKYHVAFFERPVPTRQYSEDAVELVRNYLSGENYQIDLPPRQLEAASVEQ